MAAQSGANERATAFLNERPMFVASREKRLGGALGVSLGIHVVALILFLIVSQIPRPTQAVPTPRNPDQIVWIAQPGPGGGGGGGGTENREPPKKLEAPGEDKLSVPVEKKPELTKLEPPQEVPEPPPLKIPAQTMAAALENLPGVIEGPPAPTLSQGSGTGGGAGTGEGTGSGSGTGSGLGEGVGGGFGGGVYRPGSGIELPRVIREVRPSYTADAMRAKVQGIVELEAVVLPDGTVGDVQITRSLDRTFGLDQKAIEAVRQWRFEPGTRLGQPVAVLVTIELTFTLR